MLFFARINLTTPLKKELCEIGEEAIWESRFTSFFSNFSNIPNFINCSDSFNFPNSRFSKFFKYSKTYNVF